MKVMTYTNLPHSGAAGESHTSLRSSRNDLTLIYLDVTIHPRTAEWKKSRDKS